MKKICAMILCCAVLLCLFGMSAATASVIQTYEAENGAVWKFYVDDDGAYLCGISFVGLANLEPLVIPSTVDLYGRWLPVKRIVHAKSYGFNLPHLSSVLIPSSVEVIDEMAFADCTNLSSVTFADNSSLKRIGPSAFARCSALGYIEFPASLEIIDACAFSETRFEYMDLSGTNVTTIGSKAFYDSWLHEIQLPPTITTIMANAFNTGDTVHAVYPGTEKQWKKVSIGSGNENLSVQCDGPEPTVSSVTSYNVTQTNATVKATFTASESGAWTQSGVRLYNASGAEIASKTEYHNYNMSKLDVWYNVNSELNTVLEPNTKYYFEIYTYYDGTRHTSSRTAFTTRQATTMTWQNTVEAVTDNSFTFSIRGKANTTGTFTRYTFTLKDLETGDTIKAFTKSDDSNLNIPGAEWFSLVSYTPEDSLPAGRTYIYQVSYTFEGKEYFSDWYSVKTTDSYGPTVGGQISTDVSRKGFTQEISIQDNARVSGMNVYVYNNVDGESAKIQVYPEITESQLYSTSATHKWWFTAGTVYVDIDEVGGRRDCRYYVLVDAYDQSGNHTTGLASEYGTYISDTYPETTGVEVTASDPDGFTLSVRGTNGYYNGIASFEAAVYPEGQTQESAFWTSAAASSGTVSEATMTVRFAETGFTGADSFTVDVYTVGTDHDRSAEPMSITVNAIKGGNIGDGLTWELRNGCLKIAGAGAIPDYTDAADTPWYAWADTVAQVVIGDGVTSIGAYAFSGCKSLQSVTVPESVTGVGENAFSGCLSISDLYYLGDPYGWQNVAISSGNVSLTEAPIRYARLTGACGESLTWQLENGVLTVSGSGTMTNYTDTNPAPWSSDAESITQVVIENGAVSVGERAFSGCASLTGATLPDSVKIIGERAFAGCASLNSVTLGSGVTFVGAGAFSGCDRLNHVFYGGSQSAWSSVYIGGENENLTGANLVISSAVIASGSCGENVTWALDSEGTFVISGRGAMTDYDSYTVTPWYTDYRDSIKKVFIKSGVTNIGASAFNNLPKMTHITISETVEKIGNSGLYGCEALTDIEVYSGNPSYSSEDGVLFNRDKSELISYPAGKTNASYTVPQTVRKIGVSAFSRNKNLAELTLQPGLVEIGTMAFHDCDRLTEVILPSGMETIGNSAFYNCEALTRVTLPDTVKTIGSNAFYWCENLVDANIPGSVTKIGDGAFYQCPKLAGPIVIPDGITKIGQLTFELCQSVTCVTIPESVTSIGWEAFNRCNNLQDVYFGGSAQEWSVMDIGSGNTCLTNATIHYGKFTGTCGDSLTWTWKNGQLTISGTGEMNSYASATIPGVPYTMGGKAPWYNYRANTTLLVVEEGVTSIGASAFADFTAMTEVILPTSLDRVGSNAFSGCQNLTEVIYGGSNYDWAAIDIAETGNAYLTGANIRYQTYFADLTLPAGLETIEEEAFASVQVASVYIPATVKSIADNAFDEGIIIVAPAESFAAGWAREHGYPLIEQ